MKVIGITGGVGSGKSAVLAWMEQEYGACICQMDEVAKQLQKKGTECFKKIVDEFGDAVVGEDGELDRKELGKMVFSSAEKLQCLNAIVHPAVLKWVQKDIVEKRKQGKPLYVVEAALLTDTGRELCDEMWYIYTSENIRRQRLHFPVRVFARSLTMIRSIRWTCMKHSCYRLSAPIVCLCHFPVSLFQRVNARECVTV